MNITELYTRVLQLEFLSFEEAVFLYKKASTSELMFVADEIRKKLHSEPVVTWIIDRNVNITNVCGSACKFCNFYRPISSEDAFTTTFEQYKCKINELYRLGGRQLLLQGGMSPDLKLEYYMELFKRLKNEYPDLKLHALGPPEVVHLAHKDNMSFRETLYCLITSGLDSLPGAGAEILSDRVRKILSPAKCTKDEWLKVMREAHLLGLTTSATMMFGHIETVEERIQHIFYIRGIQEEKPKDAKGFISFICWPFQDDNTVLKSKLGIRNSVTADEYVRMIAMSRILLPNVLNIQASWLTVGTETAQLCLHAGANDMGSIMIEENVVSAAGANYSLDATAMKRVIAEAGFIPKLRNQQFEIIEEN